MPCPKSHFTSMTKSSTSFGCLTFGVLMAIVKLNTAKNTTIFKKFEIRKNFDSCNKVEFVYENVFDDLRCMVKCAKNDTCKGVYSDASTGHCVGCSQAGPSSENSDIINGTYFELRPKPSVKSCEGPDWKMFKDFCYYFTQQQPGFQAALNDCRRRGADIAVIENEDENAFLIEQAKAGGALFYITGVVSDPQVLNGTWVRYNTTIPVSYLPWHSGHPNNPADSPRCVYLNSGRKNYEWEDKYCEEFKKNNVQMICKM